MAIDLHWLWILGGLVYDFEDFQTLSLLIIPSYILYLFIFFNKNIFFSSR